MCAYSFGSILRSWIVSLKLPPLRRNPFCHNLQVDRKFEMKLYLVSSNPHMLRMFRELANQRDLFKLGWGAPGDAPANMAQALDSCTATGSEWLVDEAEALRRVSLTAKGTEVLKAHLQDT